MKNMCVTCRRPKSEHTGSGLCPYVATYFTPCTHPNKQGMGVLGSDGTSWSDTTCQTCGERFVIGKPPYEVFV